MSEFTRFIIAGGIAAGGNFLSRFVYSMIFSFQCSVILSYLTGMTIAFILFKRNVFKRSQSDLSQEIFYFIAITGIALLQTWGISLLLYQYGLPIIHIAAKNETVSHLIGILVPIITSYVGHKYFTFKKIAEEPA